MHGAERMQYVSHVLAKALHEALQERDQARAEVERLAAGQETETCNVSMGPDGPVAVTIDGVEYRLRLPDGGGTECTGQVEDLARRGEQDRQTLLAEIDQAGRDGQTAARELAVARDQLAATEEQLSAAIADRNRHQAEKHQAWERQRELEAEVERLKGELRMADVVEDEAEAQADTMEKTMQEVVASALDWKGRFEREAAKVRRLEGELAKEKDRNARLAGQVGDEWVVLPDGTRRRLTAWERNTGDLPEGAQRAAGRKNPTEER